MNIGQLILNFNQYVKEGPWLQFVGYVLAFGGLIGHTHWYGIALAYLGLGISMAGTFYKRLYP